MNLTLKIIIAVILCLLVGFLTGFATQSSITDWYAFLNKPSFNPPNWLFAPVWTVLYTMMGIAAALIWHKGWESSGVKAALGLFTLQLLLNGSWSLIFFGLRQPMPALIVIIILWALIFWCILRFMKLRKAAGYLLIPYLLWVSFATLLNYSIVALN